MLDPSKLLEAARQLVAVQTPEADRRAISTAYYALFHCLAAHAADRFVGKGDTAPAYVLIYRSLDHSRARALLTELTKSTLKPSVRKALGCVTSSPALRSFANVFIQLQELRQLADYHPHLPTLSRQEIDDLLDDALGALQSFEAVDAIEKRDVLALMVAGTRS